MDYYKEIKNELVDNEITKKVKDYSKNRSDLMHYYNVGKLLVDAQGGESRARYGDGLIKEYSKRLINELDKKYSYRNLMSMRKFYLLFKNEKVNALRTQLSWTHYRELLVLNDFDEIKYYIDVCVYNNLSYRELHIRIKSNEYKRLDIKTIDKLNDKQATGVTDLIKNPIIIKNNLNVSEISDMNYIDKHVKEMYHDKTIGIIICKRDNKLVLEYSSDSRIFSTTYELIVN